MKEKQKVLRILSIVIIIWQVLSGFFKIGICSLLLLGSILTCSSYEIADSLAQRINANVNKGNAVNSTFYFSGSEIQGALEHFQNGVLTGNDVSVISGFVAVCVAFVVIEILIVKIFFVTAGGFGISASKNLQKAKKAFGFGCVGIVISFVQAVLTYLGLGFIRLAGIYTASNMNMDINFVPVNTGSAIAFPVVFVVFTVIIGIINHENKKNKQAYSASDRQ